MPGRVLWLRPNFPGKPHKCARNFTQILLGRSPQASFLLADTPPPGRILRLGSRLFLLKIPSGMFPPCHLLAVNGLRLRRDETCKEGADIHLGIYTAWPSKCLTSQDPDKFLCGSHLQWQSVRNIQHDDYSYQHCLLGVKFRYSHHTHYSSNCEIIC